MIDFLRKRKNPNGSFSCSLNEESDLRSTYAALIIMRLLNIESEELNSIIVEYTLSC